MKRFTLAIILVASMMAFGQSAGGSAATAASSGGLAFGKGDNNIGVGLNLGYGYGYGAIGISSAWDHMLNATDMFSLGAELSASFSGSGGLGLSYYISPQFRFGFHPFGIPSLQGKVPIANELDPYVVLHLGPTIWGYDYDYGFGTTASDTDVGFYDWGIAFGARWMFKENMGLWGEVDWNRFIVGISWKF